MDKRYINKQDYIGKKYGRLTAVGFVKYDKNRHQLWKFECECGNIKNLLLTEVKRGIIKSCGCISKEGLGEGVAGLNEIYANYQRRASRKNMKFEITKEEFKELTSHDCFYCGAIPSNKYTKSPVGDFTYNGLDRLDSSEGYTMNNVVPCCKKCNEAKMDLSPRDFYAWIEKTYFFMKKHEAYFKD